MITLALVLTPVASARALAELCGLSGIDVDVVPSRRGAVAVRAVGAPTAHAQSPTLAAGEAGDVDEPVGEGDWDIGELFADPIPAEARELAAAISRLTRIGVVLVTAQLTEDGGPDPGLSGQLTAARYAGGEAGEELPAGLVLAGADDVVEDLLLGRRGVADIPGHVSSRETPPRRRSGWFGKGTRRPRP